ncbi:TonB-dependent receptor plug domain-containing protein [Roseateles oligotrophus]|uniref:TonB-dependent receptor n=1 Tax=Roseateles oligotrophus TaxID=1769250 RepID=A0ABT2YAB6_9BURK|nr:TonB-dependent receptor [Roseateles oligotrophus]MCV2366527.1 TonB-dependent receptor [Roseateles oligotrophus]
MSRSGSFIHRLFSAVLFATSTNLACAVAATPLMELSLEDLLQVRITAATLTEASLTTVPASATVFVREQIQQLGVKTLEELMNHVPGYQSFLIDDANALYSSRSRRIAFATREVLVILDGQRLNHDTFGGSNDNNLPLANVARVEFLRGPGSAIYGANAFLGVINIITSKTLNDAAVSLVGARKIYSEINASHAFDNGLQTSIFIQGVNGKGEKQSVFAPAEGKFTNVQPDRSDQVINWNAQWGEWALQAHYANSRVDGGYVIGSANDDDNKLRTRTSFWAMNYRHQISDGWLVSSRIFNSNFSNLYQFRQTTAPAIASSISSGREIGSENRLSWHQGKADALLGFDYSHNSGDAQAQIWLPPAAPQASIDAIPSTKRNVAALYAQWQDDFFDGLSYIMGVRHDQYSDIGGNTSPRLGLIWKMNLKNTLKILYGEAFRAPAYNELGYKNNFFQVGNPNLTPELAKTTELIWIHSDAGHFSSISLFDTDIKNSVELNLATPLPHPYINGANQHMHGAEFEWLWHFANNWQLRSNLTHMFKPAVAINKDAESMAGASVIYQARGLSASLSGRYRGAVKTRDASAQGYHALGAFALFDAHVNYRIDSAWQIFGTVRNLADRNYTLPAAVNNVGVPGGRRQVEIGARWYF